MREHVRSEATTIQRGVEKLLKTAITECGNAFACSGMAFDPEARMGFVGEGGRSVHKYVEASSSEEEEEKTAEDKDVLAPAPVAEDAPFESSSSESTL